MQPAFRASRAVSTLAREYGANPITTTASPFLNEPKKHYDGLLALLFPHTASGGLLQWRAAWRDSRSHFWTISTTAVMVILPVMAVSTVFAVILELMGTDASTGALSYGLLIVQSAATLFYAATTATCSVWSTIWPGS